MIPWHGFATRALDLKHGLQTHATNFVQTSPQILRPAAMRQKENAAETRIDTNFHESEIE